MTLKTGYRLVQIPKIVDDRGCLSFVQYEQLLDFVVKRVYWLYNIKKDRGGHAHKTLQQFIFCAHGSVDLSLDDGTDQVVVKLDSPDTGLIIDEPLWRDVKNFSHDAVLVSLASEIYDENDYIRSYKEFKKWKTSNDGLPNRLPRH